LILGSLPGIVGIFSRFFIYSLFIRNHSGFFRILERVIIEYPGNLSIGKNVGINYGSWINARGGVRIGDNSILGPYCIIHSANHRLEDPEMVIQLQGFTEAPVAIGDNVWMGARVTLLPGTSIGNNAVVGAGAVVTHDIPPNVVVAGNPAKIIRSRSDFVENKAN
jgi:hypothetical protein